MLMEGSTIVNRLNIVYSEKRMYNISRDGRASAPGEVLLLVSNLWTVVDLFQTLEIQFILHSRKNIYREDTKNFLAINIGFLSMCEFCKIC